MEEAMNSTVNGEGTHEVLVLDSKPSEFGTLKNNRRWRLHSHGQGIKRQYLKQHEAHQVDINSSKLCNEISIYKLILPRSELWIVELQHFKSVTWYLKTGFTVLRYKMLFFSFNNPDARSKKLQWIIIIFPPISFSSYLPHLYSLPVLWDRIWLAIQQHGCKFILLKPLLFTHQQSTVCWH